MVRRRTSQQLRSQQSSFQRPWNSSKLATDVRLRPSSSARLTKLSSIRRLLIKKILNIHPPSKRVWRLKTCTNGLNIQLNVLHVLLNFRRLVAATSSCTLMIFQYKDALAVIFMSQLLTLNLTIASSRHVLMMEQIQLLLRNALMMLISTNTMLLERHTVPIPWQSTRLSRRVQPSVLQSCRVKALLLLIPLGWLRMVSSVERVW